MTLNAELLLIKFYQRPLTGVPHFLPYRIRVSKARSAMDLDATVRRTGVNVEDIENLMPSIIAVPIEDGMEFQVKSISEIMDEAESSIFYCEFSLL